MEKIKISNFFKITLLFVIFLFIASTASITASEESQSAVEPASESFIAEFLNIEPTATVSGTVFQSNGTTPITGTSIHIGVIDGDPCQSWGGQWAGGVDINQLDGTYTITDIPAGTYYIKSWSGDTGNYTDEFWTGGSPDPSSYDCKLAQKVQVTAGQVLSSQNFALEIGGGLSGVLYNSDGVTPITGESVVVDIVDGDPCGDHEWLGNTSSNSLDGTYSRMGIPPGNYYIKTWHNNTNYIGEWWNGLSPDPSDFDCSLAQTVTFISGTVASSKNFHLPLGGKVSGTIYQSDGVTPVTDYSLSVDLYGGSNACDYQYATWGGSSDTANGTYLSDDPILPGTYFLKIWRDNTNYVEEWWNGSSPDPSNVDCSLAQTITITANATVPDINFELDQGAIINGTVFESNGTTPITSEQIKVDVFEVEGNPCNRFVNWLGGELTNTSDGSYSIQIGLPAGTYYLRIWPNDTFYVSEWWNGSSPDPSSYDCNLAQSLTVTAGSTRNSINFAVDRGGSISGNLYHEDGVTPITGSSIRVDALLGDPCGEVINVGSAWPNSGTYTIYGVPAGMNVNIQSINRGANYIEEWWNGSSPDPSNYDCNLAQTLSVSADTDRSGINLNIETGATISGTLYQSDGVTPITGETLRVFVYSNKECLWPSLVADAISDSTDGTFTIQALRAGTVYLRAENNGTGYVDEWWTGSSPDPSSYKCTDAQPLNINSGQTITGKDFFLEVGSAISGTVFQSNGTTPITGNQFYIDMYFGNPCGTEDQRGWVANALTDGSNGTYTMTNVPSGINYLRVWHNYTDYVREWWNGSSPDPSSYDCNLAQVMNPAPGSTINGVNFALEMGGNISGTLYQSDGITVIDDRGFRVDAVLGDACGTNQPVGSGWTGDGNYTINGVPAGMNVYLQSFDQDGNYLNEWWTGSSSDPSSYYCSQAQTVSVASGGSISSKNFELTTNVPPFIQLLQPDGINDSTVSGYTIVWQDSDLDDNANIALYYDTDSSGFDGTLIASGIKEDAANYYIWDTSGIPAGSYYIYAGIKDPVNPEVIDYSSGPVTILTACLEGICNPSFENELDYWAASGTPNNQISTDAIDGTYSLQSEHTRTTGDNPVWSGVNQVINSVEPAQTYGISMWVKGQNATRGHVKIKWYNSVGAVSQVDYPIININGTIGWTSLSKLVTSPADAVSSQLYIWHGINVSSQNVQGSTLWVDNIEFDVATSACGTLCNESFEQGLLYWTVSGAVGSHNIETTGAHEGLKAARSEQLYTSGDAAKWAGITQYAQVKEGTTYRFRFWLKKTNLNSAHVRIRWRNSSGSLLSTEYPITGINGTTSTWYKRESNVTAPATAVKAEISIWHGVNGGVNVPGSTMWIDDITMICQSLCNGGFEDGTVHWEANGRNEAVIVTTAVQEGTQAIKVAQGLGASDNTQWAGVSQRTLVTGGNSYNLSFWLKKENAVQGHVKIKWRDANDQVISTQYPIGGINGTNMTWTQMSTTITAPTVPAPAQTVEIFFWHGVDGANLNATGSTLYLDNTAFTLIP